MKRSTAASLSLFLFGLLIFSVAKSEEIELPMNGDLMMNKEVVYAGNIDSLSKYKAAVEDKTHADEFKNSNYQDKENSVKNLLKSEITDIAYRVHSKIAELETQEYPNSEEYWSDIERKIMSLRISADVLKEENYPDLEDMIISGILEAHEVSIFNDDGSLCDVPPDETCPGSKVMYLVDIIKMVKNEQAQEKLLSVIGNFAHLQALPDRPALCLNPEDENEQNQKQLGPSVYCGMLASHKVRKAIKNGISIISYGNKDSSHTCRAIQLNLKKIQNSNSSSSVQLDTSKENFVEDSAGNRIYIGPAEFKSIQAAVK